ncbi:KGGVGR-motif variant AAA ATPase [Thiobaca trueperi]|uniref:MinD-like ATPase involved in chromosome partitioning or flagellar assembly n=1 Tax=Thiobaca trueperi TaxID=127458 RepID=A0A4R3MYU8_9GAMM|nr:ParA family protein [Thiobaca trueperi]TCT21574.1 MinD-like ATPase involved in chromosome partitioning or flagellar assembly [Thiobaca trueperi]
MTLHNGAIERLLTWLDVERVLKQQTNLWTRLPDGIQGVDCFADGMEIRHAADPSQVDSWLSDLFGHAYQREPQAIILRIGNATYPVELVQENTAAALATGQNYPLWRDVTYLPADTNEAETGVTAALEGRPLANAPKDWENGPALVSFHSFKGGVGRTSTLMTYVAACMQDPGQGPKKVLVVDADLEAPGVSFWLDEGNRPTVSFVQLLEALHYPPADLDATLEFFAQELRKTSLNVGGVQRELFVLPAALDLLEIQDMPVVPEHLARNPSNPWQLTDHLHALGQRLGVDAVFIDLRAGLSELASPVLFDPRVDHFLVSTVAPQSVQGMAEVLRRLYAFNRQLPAERQNAARPTVVLSLLTKDLREAGHYEQALRVLGEAYPAADADDALTPGVQWLEAEFLSTLMSIGSVREALDTLPQSSRLFTSASEWAKALYATPIPLRSTDQATAIGQNTSSRQTQARKLHEVCEAAEFADSSDTSEILATEPLLNLGKHYARELPNLLMIGAKGSGKTFTFRRVVRACSWKIFLKTLGFDSSGLIDAGIFPVLWSSNIEDRQDGEIKGAQGSVLDSIQVNKQLLLSGSAVQREIQDVLQHPPNHWEDFWDGLIARQLGITEGGLQTLNQFLAAKELRVVFVFDGIEDAFKDATEGRASEAIEALLRLPNRVSELENRHLGAMVFVRADYVQATIRQNLGQLLQRFLPFRLQWNPESFLRLAFMLSCQAGINEGDSKLAESLRIEQLKDKLERLWGKKLGNEKSKEAHSARWVYAALCDLKGNVQARDLVRFLRIAADLESERVGQTWPDRVLAPESLRKALPRCSIEKVKEAKTEIASLRKWMEMMEQAGIRNLKVPFSMQQAQLNTALLSALQEIGVIYEDLDGKLGDERLFLPEIYRTGLGVETSAAGRPRMQALLKKNIGAIPL